MARDRRPGHGAPGARVAMDDLLVDWRMTLCFVLALAAVLAPLLVLFGLKFGVMETMRERILTDPTTLEVTVLGNTDRDFAFFDSLRARSDVAFVIPKTRSIAATLYIQPGGSGRLGAAELAELIPTADGDPLLAGLRRPSGIDEVVLSHKLARELDVGPGGTVRGFALRDVDGTRQRGDVMLNVTDVMPPARFTRLGIFATLPLLVAVEDYRDGYAAPAVGWSGGDEPSVRTNFASARLFARSLEALPGLVSHLETQGIPTKSRAAEVDDILALDKGLTVGFWIVAGLGGLGYFFSLAASLWSNVERKRIPLSILKLLGMRRAGLIAFPMTQALVIGFLGALAAIAFFFLADVVVEVTFSRVLGETENEICKLLPSHLALAVGATMLFSMLASLWAAGRVAGIQPSDGMRET